MRAVKDFVESEGKGKRCKRFNFIRVDKIIISR